MRFKQWMAVGALLAVSSPVVAQTIVNGDFEQGPSAGWTMWSQNPSGQGLIGTAAAFASTEISPTVYPRSGNYMGRIGGFSYTANNLQRLIELPNTRPLYLGMYFQSRTASTSECNGLWVGAQIRIQIAGEIVYDSYLCQYNDLHDWTLGYFDVSTAAGRTIDFVIQADAANTVWSFVYIDDVGMSSSTSVAGELLGTLPESMALGDAWPNPFDAGVRVPVDLPQPGDVRLTVYDMLGRTVLAPIQELLPAGRHDIEMDGADLPPGVYVVQVEAAGALRTTRIVRKG